MAQNTYIYLTEDDGANGKKAVYPVTDVNAIIGLGDKNGSLISRIEDIEKRLETLENKVNYH